MREQLANLSFGDRKALLKKLLEQREAPGDALPAIDQPVSINQRGLWFLHQLAPTSDAYNVAFALTIHSALDKEVLRRALAALVQRHEALRMSFVARDGEPIARILPASSLVFTESDATADSLAAFAQRLEAAYRWPFDLAQGPAARFHLFRRPAGEHVLLLAVHHIVFDFWSYNIVLEELGQLYAAFIAGREAALPPLTARYADFVRAQRRKLAGAAGEQLWHFWNQRLGGGELPVLDLPADRPRPALRRGRGGSHLFELGDAGPWRRLARQRGTTLYTTLLALFHGLLHRVTGERDLLVGSPTAGRDRTAFERLVGYLVNMVVLRTDVGGDPPFTELLEKTSATVLDALEHQDFPFPLLVERLCPERDPGRSPLFQVVFALETPHRFKSLSVFGGGRGRSELGGLEISFVDTGRQLEGQFDLTLVVIEQPDGLAATFYYDADLFDATTIARLSHHYRQLLQDVSARPESPVSELTLLRPAERHQVVAEWNDSPPAGGGEPTIHGRFTALAAVMPDSVAVTLGGWVEITYGEIEHRSNQLAHRLIASGIVAEELVGLAVRRRGARIVALLGILKAGAAYLPLDPESPAERLRGMLQDTGVRVLLSDAESAITLPAEGRRLLLLETGAGGMGGMVAVSSPRPSPLHLAYVIHTSGSTGRPKGVAVTHGAVLRLLDESSYADSGPRPTFLHAAPLAFDASTFEIWVALLSGARLALLPPGRPSLAELASVIERQRVTTAWLTSGLFHQMVDEHLGTLAGVRRLLAGGDVLSVSHVERWLKATRGGRLINGYGPTENTVFTCCHPMASVADLAPATVPIGRPLAGTRVAIFDRDLGPVSAGVTGDLYAGGAGLARGYHGRSALTAERFVPDPSTAAPGARLYRTGDQARWLPGGTVEFLGRRDHQVKLRGFRIELGEIEAALSARTEVRSALVVARQDRADDRRLVAYVVAEPGVPLSVTDLSLHLGEHLPAYMVPSAFVELDSLPLTVNGKVDRARLPAPDDFEDIAPTPTPRASRSPLEESLAWILAEVLGVPRVGVRQSFFELGGHSLLATRAVSRIRRTFGVELGLEVFFAGPTVAELAAAVEQALAGTDGRQEPFEALSRTDQERWPLSFPQQRLWFLEQLEPGDMIYTIPGAVRLAGQLDPAALAAALTDLASRHEALRTVFDTDAAGDLVQRVRPASAVAMPLIDLRRVAADTPAVLRRVAEWVATEPFDLRRGPLLRVALVRQQDQRHTLLLFLHHIVGDGWSLSILLRDLVAAYGARRTGVAPALPALDFSYIDFVDWQRRALVGEALDQEVGFWRQRLADAPLLLELPTDRPRPATRRPRGASFDFELSAQTLTAVETLGQSRGATLFMTLLAAFQALLARHSHQDDHLVGVPVAGRDRREIEGLVGFFVNTLVLRADVRSRPTFIELLDRVRRTAIEAMSHARLPFERLVEELAPERDLGHAPLCQVVFALQNTGFETETLPGLEMKLEPIELPATRFDLEWHLWRDGERLRGRLIYSVALFDSTTVARLAGQFGRLLASAVADAESRVDALDQLSPGQRHQLLLAWNDTVDTASAAENLSELFTRQVVGAPERIALELGDVRLTYGEIDVRSNHLARYLAHLGVVAEEPVGLLLEVSPELVVGILAIVKVGAAYVPLDPSYPAARRLFMVEDTGLRFLLTHTSFVASATSSLPAAVRAIALDEDLYRQVHIDAQTETHVEDLRISGEQTAFILYTSGSTGIPKGIQISHGAVRHMARNPDYTRLRSGDRVALISNIAFDAATYEIWGALLNGGCLVGFGRQVLLDPPRLAAALRASRMDVVFLTTALFNQLADSVPHALAPLREVLTGGEAVDPRAMAKVLEHGAPRHLIHLYGPTENTTFSSYQPVRSVPPQAPTLPIGRPIRGSTLFVMDRFLRLVSSGGEGELALGGRGLARGYLGRSALTAERFVPSPCAAAYGERLYLTSDRVRLLADGTVEFRGRFDHQVKIRGFRIELGEIEALLTEHPAVSSALVTVTVAGEKSLAVGTKNLAAYVVGAPDLTWTEAALRSHLAARLPGYMVPSFFVRLDYFPLTPNGKIDRQALPEPGEAGGEPAGAAPRSPLEEVLSGIWAAVLGRRQVGLHDNFFEIGGHSLSATRLITRVRQDLRVDLPLRTVFEAPTLAAMAGRVALARGEALSPEETVIPRRPPADEAPLTFAQERLWFLDRLDSGSASLNMPSAVRLAGRLDHRALEDALDALVERHEVLRTTFTMDGGEPRQRIAGSVSVSARRVDLSRLPEPVQRREAERCRAREASLPFDLEHGPLFRAWLLRLGPGDHQLVLDQHHIVSDGWSMGILMDELAAFYGAFVNSAPSPLPPLSIQYADYAVWQRGTWHRDKLDEQLAYWRQRLADAPPLLELPVDHPRPAVQRYRGGYLTHTLAPPLAAALRDLALRHSATLFMTLLAVFKVLLARLSGQSDIVVGTPVAGRLHPQVEPLLGCFLNTLVLRTDMAGAVDFDDLLARVRETALGAYAHQELPFERLLEELQPERSLSHTPLFQVFFNMPNVPLRPLDLAGLVVTPLVQPDVPSKFDLTVYAVEEGEALTLHLVYNADLFSDKRAAEIMAQYEGLLVQVSEQPKAALETLSLLTPTARRVLPDPTAALADHWHGAVHEVFARRAMETPQALAVDDMDGKLTYAELAALVEALAAELASTGVVRGDVVVLLAHRGAGVVWALLGILRSGAAFALIDPAYPAARQATLVRQAAPRVWLEARPRSAELAPEVTAALSELGCPTIILPPRAAWERFAASRGQAPDIAVGPDDLACLGFTSGSTGLPKGIRGRQGSLTHFTPWMRATYALAPADRFSLLSGLAHDPLQRDVFTPLQMGAAVVIPDPDRLFQAGWLARWMSDQAITVAHLTPAMAQLVTEPTEIGAGRAPCLSALRYVFLVGDVLTWRDVLRLRQLAPTVECVNHYGSTETQRAVGYHRIAADQNPRDDAGQVLPLGRGIPGVQLLVRTERGDLAGIGEVGEICVRSPHVALGYLDEAATAERFEANPFLNRAARKSGDTIYRTGDLGRYQPNGEVVFVGRADQQVQLRGYRVEPGEIEATLGRRSEVGEVVVTLRRDSGKPLLVAYLVAAAAEPIDPAELRAWAGRLLPPYMVPNVFHVLEALPRTANGKIDRRALPAVGPGRESRSLPPRAGLESRLAAIWCELLSLDEVGAEDNFFDLGGHSLLLVRLNSRLAAAEWGRELPLTDLFNYPNVRALARYLGDQHAPPPALDKARSLGQRQLRALSALKSRKKRTPTKDPSLSR